MRRSCTVIILEKMWYGTYSDKPDGVWDKTAEDTTKKQHLRPKTGYCQEAHPHHPCYHDWSTERLGCRRFQRDNRNNISTIEEALTDCALPAPLGPTPLWGPGSIPNNRADVCGFLKPPGSDRYWKVRMHGASCPFVSGSHLHGCSCDSPRRQWRIPRFFFL